MHFKLKLQILILEIEMANDVDHVHGGKIIFLFPQATQEYAIEAISELLTVPVIQVCSGMVLLLMIPDK